MVKKVGKARILEKEKPKSVFAIESLDVSYQTIHLKSVAIWSNDIRRANVNEAGLTLVAAKSGTI